MTLKTFWHRAFLEERPSISLSLFRFAVSFTVGAHMVPSLLHPEENYLAGAYKSLNTHFFTPEVLKWVATSPDELVYAITTLFYLSLFAFAIGFSARFSCILMTLSCYYFYALNRFQIGTLSFDILLVTLFLMCVTSYAGDSFSFSSFLKGNDVGYKRKRPFFLQRLLQLQIAATFLQTALGKITTLPGAPLQGNWFNDNPYYYLLRYPEGSVVRDFPFREWLVQYPDLCYWLGVILIVFEFVLPILWFVPRARLFAITLGIAFQFMIWQTLHVPSTFIFLFPPMMLLFIPPERVVAWIEQRRDRHAAKPQSVLLYDGECDFCLQSLKRLQALDCFGKIRLVDFHKIPDLSLYHSDLEEQRCKGEMVLIDTNRSLTGGFDAARRLSKKLVLCWWAVPILWFPGVAWAGRRLYRWIAANRYRFHLNTRCKTNQCGVTSS